MTLDRMSHDGTHDAEANADTARVTVTDTTLPAAPDELTFYEHDSTGVVYAKHDETGELTAITVDHEHTDVAPVLGEIDESELTELESVDPQLSSNMSRTRRRGD